MDTKSSGRTDTRYATAAAAAAAASIPARPLLPLLHFLIAATPLRVPFCAAATGLLACACVSSFSPRATRQPAAVAALADSCQSRCAAGSWPSRSGASICCHRHRADPGSRGAQPFAAFCPAEHSILGSAGREISFGGSGACSRSLTTDGSAAARLTDDTCSTCVQLFGAWCATSACNLAGSMAGRTLNTLIMRTWDDRHRHAATAASSLLRADVHRSEGRFLRVGAGVAARSTGSDSGAKSCASWPWLAPVPPECHLARASS